MRAAVSGKRHRPAWVVIEAEHAHKAGQSLIGLPWEQTKVLQLQPADWEVESPIGLKMIFRS